MAIAVETVARGLRGVLVEIPLGGGLRIPTRTSIIRRDSGEQLLVSPVMGLAAVRDEILAAGPVVGLLAPNALHHLGLEDAQGLFPGALIHAGARVQRKEPELKFASTLGKDASPWPDELEVVPIDGLPGLEEFALLHRPSRSLLLTDLAFHFTRQQLAHTWSRLLLRVDGVRPEALSCSRLVRRYIRDPLALRRSIDRLLALEFDRLVLGHAAVVEAGAHEKLRQAFSFLPG